MVKLSRKYIDDHLADIHTGDSWARAINEMVLKAARAKLGSNHADEIEVEAKFVVRPISTETVGRDGTITTRLCLQTCFIISAEGHEACIHAEALK